MTRLRIICRARSELWDSQSLLHSALWGTHSIFGKASEPIGNQGAASFGNSMMLMGNQPVTDLVQRMNPLACSPDFDPWVLPILFQSHLAS